MREAAELLRAGGQAADVLPGARLLRDIASARFDEVRRSREQVRDRGQRAVATSLPSPPSPALSRRSRTPLPVVATAVEVVARAAAESERSTSR